MVIKVLFFILSLALLSACSSRFVGPISAGPDSYVISKKISAFSKQEDALLSSILSQANDYCTEQERYMEIKHLNEYTGFFGNDTKTTIVFSCLSQKEKEYEQLPPVVIIAPTPKVTPTVAPAPVVLEIKEPEFPINNKLTNYAF